MPGALWARRDFGKAAFIQVQDRTGRLQIYVGKNKIGDEQFAVFGKLDVGDIVGISGKPFRH